MRQYNKTLHHVLNEECFSLYANDMIASAILKMRDWADDRKSNGWYYYVHDGTINYNHSIPFHGVRFFFSEESDMVDFTLKWL